MYISTYLLTLIRKNYLIDLMVEIIFSVLFDKFTFDQYTKKSYSNLKNDESLCNCCVLKKETVIDFEHRCKTHAAIFRKIFYKSLPALGSY